MAAISLPEQVFLTRRFSLGAPGRFTITPDGSQVLFLRSRAGDDPAGCLWALDVASGTERLLADPANLRGSPSSAGGSPPPAGGGTPAAGGGTPMAGGGAPTAGIGGYATDRAAGLAAFTLAGALWTVHVASGRVRQLPARPGAASPQPDPAGQRIAYTCHGGLRVIEADGTGDRPVAGPDGPDASYGAIEQAGVFLLRGPYGYWWSPDGRHLLTTRVDSARVELRYIADPAHPEIAPQAVRYFAAGTASPCIILWVAGLDGSRVRVQWDHAAFEYVLDAGWDACGPCALVQSRDQTATLFLGIDPASGQTRVLSEQHDPCWVQLVPGLPARTGSGTLVAHADLDGTRCLTVDGEPVTPPGLQLRAVLSMDGEQILFTASSEPTQTHLWTWSRSEGARQLSTAAGVHSGARRGGTLVREARCAAPVGGRFTVLREGCPDVAIASLVQQPVLGVRAIPLVLGARRLRAALYLPSWHRAGDGPLPVLADPYGGAGRQQVTAELDFRCLISQWFAEQGFAVLVADGSGTPGRGPDWEREVHGDPFGPVLDDQVTALREAARRQPELDLGRVAIRGWSFGGALAALAVLRRPEVFHAAVAGAGVSDQLLYNAPWRERSLGHPDVFPERYSANSLVREAPRLTRPLLLIHGLADDNVYPANTLRLSSALLAAGRPHEVLLLPGVGHLALGSPVTAPLLHHQLDFLRRHLNVPLPTP